jgi:biopolymer transport protein TolR
MSVQNEPLVISIDESGKYYINVGDESLPIDLNELKRKSSIIFEANPDIEIVFQSDKDVVFDSVAKAMAACTKCGNNKNRNSNNRLCKLSLTTFLLHLFHLYFMHLLFYF